MKPIPTKDDLLNARQRIQKYIHKTPVMTSRSINELLQCNLFFKCENLQRAGAFKMRGATNALLSLSNEELKKGVITHSSGNHAAALSLAAKTFKTKATVVMPRTAPEFKKQSVVNFGAEVIFCEPTVESRVTTTNSLIEKYNYTLIHSYDNPNIIAGQSTAAWELFEEIQNLDFIVSPVGGGGVSSGACLACKYFNPKVKVIGAEPKGADDAYRSLRDKKIYPSINPKSIADGLLTQLSELTYSILSENIKEIITVDDDKIVEAMKLIYERLKIIVEPSSAITLAVILEKKAQFKNKNVGLIITGGNVDLNKLPF
ncbi:MAG: pyridoxal-phosphate dependent enzyme [Ignavibacteriales bacterium]|nr:pyridoxal-phosphate dependent enzyme [Ignavibacteriales bacterium]